MSHHITIANLVLDFKRANEGSNIDVSAMLSVIAPIAAAYVPPIPPGADYEAEDMYNKIARRFFNHILSDVGELCIYNSANSSNIAKAVYVTRYQHAYSGVLAPELPSVSEIVKALTNDLFDPAPVMAWYPRFHEAFTNYYKEFTCKGE